MTIRHAMLGILFNSITGLYDEKTPAKMYRKLREIRKSSRIWRKTSISNSVTSGRLRKMVGCHLEFVNKE